MYSREDLKFFDQTIRKKNTDLMIKELSEAKNGYDAFEISIKHIEKLLGRSKPEELKPLLAETCLFNRGLIHCIENANSVEEIKYYMKNLTDL